MTDSLDLLQPDLRTRVQAGELHLAPAAKWANAAKPVVLDAQNRMVQGSGGYAKAADQAADNGRKSAFKQTSTYKQALEYMIPFGLSDTEAAERRITFERLIDLAFDAMEGEQYVDCPHTGENGVCNSKTTHKIRVAAPDGKLIFNLIELLAGKAKETIETTHTERHVEVLMQVRDIPLGVFDIEPEVAAQRQQQLLDEGIIDASWYEIEEDVPEPVQ